jgi:hypothetical protein
LDSSDFVDGDFGDLGSHLIQENDWLTADIPGSPRQLCSAVCF